jgi:hypothetical protein
MMISRRTDPHVEVDVSGVFGKGSRIGRDKKYAMVSQDTTVGDVKTQVLVQLHFPAPELFCIRSGKEELPDSAKISELDPKKLRSLNLYCKDVEAFHRVLRERGLL